MPSRSEPPELRFWRFVVKLSPDKCWLWTAYRDASGYGTFSVNGYKTRAHRYSYELVHGPIPVGLVIDHLCRTRACVNPAHLEAVTTGTNTRRGSDAKTHCVNGHELTDDNIYWSVSREGWSHRQCATCRRDAEKKRRGKRIRRKQ